jgi:hypothetical protein
VHAKGTTESAGFILLSEPYEFGKRRGAFYSAQENYSPPYLKAETLSELQVLIAVHVLKIDGIS